MASVEYSRSHTRGTAMNTSGCTSRTFSNTVSAFSTKFITAPSVIEIAQPLHPEDHDVPQRRQRRIQHLVELLVVLHEEHAHVGFLGQGLHLACRIARMQPTHDGASRLRAHVGKDPVPAGVRED